MPSDDRLSRAERELFLRSFARGGISSSPGAVRALSESMSEAYYPAGTMIYQQGTMPRYVYYVVSGRVRLTTDGAVPLEYDKLSAIGGLDAIQDIPYTRTAVALEDTRLLLLPASKYLQIIEDDFEFAKRMVIFLVGQIDAMARQLPLSDVYGRDRSNVVEVAPSAPGHRLGLLERMLAARQAPLFGGLRSQVLVGLAERLEERSLAAGEPLYASLRDHAGFWMVASGELAATRSEGGASHTFLAGDVVLVFAAFADLEDGYRVVAQTPAQVLRLGKDDFFDLLEDHGDVARVALSFAAAQRTRLTNQLANTGLTAPPISQFAIRTR